MANNEFKDIEQFVEGFSRTGYTPVDYYYDGVIYGMDFEYRNKIYRISRDPTGDEKKLRLKFNKDEKSFIHFYELLEEKYPSEVAYSLDQYIGFYESIDELLNVGNIDGIPLKEIIPSSETKILAID